MSYWVGVATQVCVFMTAIIGLSILCGFTGMFSMGHAGFMAIGAYTSALLSLNFGLPIPICIIAGTILAMIIGILVSIPTLKLRDDYFMIVTLGVGEGVRLILQNMTDITGGARGLTGIPEATTIVVAVVVLVLCIIFTKSFLNTRFGRNCIAVREEELVAKSIGINIFNYKLLAMAISCALCGLAGGLLAHYMRYLNPSLFRMAKSEELIIPVILGGRGSLTGTIIASALLLPLPEFLRSGSAQEWRMVIYGLLVIIVICFRPSGLMGTKELTFKGVAEFFKNLGQGRASKDPGHSGSSEKVVKEPVPMTKDKESENNG